MQRGYEYVEGAQSSLAFFPLFQILAGAFRKLTGAWSPFAGFVISNLALLSAAVLLRRLVAIGPWLTRTLVVSTGVMTICLA